MVIRFLHHLSDRFPLRKWDGIFGGMTFFFLAIFLATTLSAYQRFALYGFDFAVFDQSIWNSARGFPFENTIIPDAPILLGQRFSPILIALVPLYVLNDQRIIVVIPAIAIVFGAFPIYWYARKKIGYHLALIVSLAYFLSPSTLILGMGQFYETHLALAFLSLATLFLLERRAKPFIVSALLTLMCKEEMGLVVAGMGLYWLIVQRRLRFGLSIFAGGLLWSVLAIGVFVPHFSGQATHYYLGGSGIYSSGHYDYLGSNFFEIAKTILTRPDLVLQHLLVPDKIAALIGIFLPFAFLPILAPVTALALPTLGYTFLSDLNQQYGVGSHHHAPVIPFLVFGTILAIERILHRHIFRQRRIGLVLALAVASALIIFPINRFDLAAILSAPSPHNILGDTLAKSIPLDASVLTQQEMITHLTQRRQVYLAPVIPCYAVADYVLVDRTQDWFNYQQDLWNDVLALPFWETLVDRDGFVLKKINPRQMSHPLDIQIDPGIRLLGYELTEKPQIDLMLFWRVTADAPSHLIDARLEDSAGHLWSESLRTPCQQADGTQQTNSNLNDNFALTLPPTMPTGDYALSIAFLDQKTRSPLSIETADRPSESSLVLETLRIQKNKKSIQASEIADIEQRLYVDMQEMRFLGYTLPAKSIAPGEILSVGVYWRAREKPRGDYAVRVQLNASNGTTAYAETSRPAKDTYPTLQWDPGEVLLDWHDLTLPTNLAPGKYQLSVELLDAQTQQTLGQVSLSEILVTP